jgi:hypothetical protein
VLTACNASWIAQPALTAMEMSGAVLDRLAGRALGTFRFILTPDISRAALTGLEHLYRLNHSFSPNGSGRPTLGGTTAL